MIVFVHHKSLMSMMMMQVLTHQEGRFGWMGAWGDHPRRLHETQLQTGDDHHHGDNDDDGDNETQLKTSVQLKMEKWFHSKTPLIANIEQNQAANFPEYETSCSRTCIRSRRTPGDTRDSILPFSLNISHWIWSSVCNAPLSVLVDIDGQDICQKLTNRSLVSLWWWAKLHMMDENVGCEIQFHTLLSSSEPF